MHHVAPQHGTSQQVLSQHVSLLPKPACRFLVAAILLMLISGLAAAATSGETGRLQQTVVPTFQTLHLTLDPSQDTYRGSSEIELLARSTAGSFQLHFVGEGEPILRLVGERGEIPTEIELDGSGTILVRTHEPLLPGRYTLQLDFVAAFGSALEGVYRVEREGASYIFSVFEPVDARKAFPCWDEPEFKIPFQLTLTVPDDHVPISNTLEEEVRVEGGWKTVVFSRTQPLPSYGVAIASGPFELSPIEGLGVPGRIVTTPGQKHLTGSAVEATRRLLPALEKYLGVPYPYAKLDLLAVPGFPSGGLENPAAPIFSEDRLLLDSHSSTTASHLSQAIILAHELSHMWFGNLVTVEWWDDIWLNESFATWISYKMAEEVFPGLEAGIARAKQSRRAFELDSQPGAPAIRSELSSPHDAFSGNAALIYEKGSQVLTMFERFVGEGRFRRSIREYLQTHAGGNASAEDFWAALDTEAGQPVSLAMRTFLEQPGFPLVEVERLGSGKLRVRQRRFSNQPGASERLLWKIPVAIRISEGASSRTEVFLLDRESSTVELAPRAAGEPSAAAPGWLFPNANASGYYRWSVPADTMQRLAEKLSERLSPVERYEYLANASSLFAAGKMESEAYLGIVSRFREDPDPAVLSALVAALGEVRNNFITPELEPAFARFVHATLFPVLDRIGLQQKLGEAAGIEGLRSDLYFRLGRDGGDQDLRQHARQLVAGFLDQRGEEHSPSPLIQPALRLAALDGDPAFFSRYWNRLRQSSNPQQSRDLLTALGSFPDPELHHKVLGACLDGTLGPGELALFSSVLIDGTRGSEPLYQWMKANYGRLQDQLPPIFRSFLPYFASGCSAERLADAEVFFARPEHRVPGSDSQMAQVVAEVENCLRLRRRGGAGVARFLAGFEQAAAIRLPSISETVAPSPVLERPESLCSSRETYSRGPI